MKIDGVVKGSPLDSVSVNLFLIHYENVWLNKINKQNGMQMN